MKAAAEPIQSKSYELGAQQELRLEVEDKITVTLSGGTAEVFGTEIAVNQPLVYERAKVAVFSWHGCSVRVDGAAKVAYVAEETPMVAYVNAHHGLHKLRAKAADEDGAGPRLMVVGPTDVGKSTLCQTMVSYAARADTRPTYVDLDVGQGAVTIPGVLSAVPTYRPVDAAEGLRMATPLAYFYGRDSPGANPDLYKRMTESLGEALDLQAHQDPAIKAAGLIINTCGWVDGVGYELLLHTAGALRVTHIVVLGHERLYADLSGDDGIRARGTVLFQLPKSGGVVPRDPSYRRETRHKRIREYFYGPANSLSPQTLYLDVAKLRIFRIGAGHQVPSSAMPIGEESFYDPMKPEEVTSYRTLVNSVLAVSYAVTADDIVSCNVAGFVLVTDFDVRQNMLVVLAPRPGQLPSKLLVVGELKWKDLL